MKILAFGAHPDDIEVGAGGTLIKCARQGHQVQFVIACVPNREELRVQEAKRAAEFVGADLLMLNLDPDALQFNRALVRVLDQIIEKHDPDIILTQWYHDSHQDHQTLSRGVIAASRENRCSLYMYEQTIPGGIVPVSFRPQLFTDISDVMDDKVKSILCHESQAHANRDWWRYGIQGRAASWGYMINVNYAEVFECVKVIDRFGHL